MTDDPTIAYVKDKIELQQRMIQCAHVDAVKRQEELGHLKIILARLERLDGVQNDG